MSPPPAIDDIPGKLAALQASLAADLTTRHIYRGCEPYTDRTAGELADGVLNILLDRENDYSTVQGMEAQEGTLSVLLIGYISVDENTAGKPQLQDAEAAFAEEIKGWVKAPGIVGFDVQMRDVRFSRQLEHPYGWIIVSLDLGPPRSNIH